MADGLFDRMSAGTGVSLWRCVISNKETTTHAKRKCFFVLQHILLGAQPRVVTSSVRYLELCPIIPYAQGFLAFQWAIGNTNSKEILNSQSGKQPALGGPAPQRQALDDFVHVLLASKVGAQDLVVEQEAFSIYHWSVLDSHPRSFIPHPLCSDCKLKWLSWKSQLANIRC